MKVSPVTLAVLAAHCRGRMIRPAYGMSLRAYVASGGPWGTHSRPSYNPPQA